MFNAALNYLYGMLYNAVEGAVLAAGMDPMFGIIHADTFGAPTLVFDLIEPFRPFADRLLMRLLYAGALDHRHFEPMKVGKAPDGAAQGVSVNREGRKILIQAFNDYQREEISFEGRSLVFKNHIFGFAGKFAIRLKHFWDHDPSGKLRHRRRSPAAESGE
jgi:CRISPR-associated protein Cas1